MPGTRFVEGGEREATHPRDAHWYGKPGLVLVQQALQVASPRGFHAGVASSSMSVRGVAALIGAFA